MLRPEPAAKRLRAWILLLGLAVLLAPGARTEQPPVRDSPPEEEQPINLWPLFVRKAEKDSLEVEVLFSLLSYHREGRRIDLALRPLYWRSVDPGRSFQRTDVLYPLFKREREGDRSSTRVLPLFFQKSTPPEFYSLLFPLYHYKSEEDRRRLGLVGFIPFTLFDFERDEVRDHTHHRYILWTYDRSGEEKKVNLPPIYSQQTSPGQGSVSLFPLFAHSWHHPTGQRRISALGFSDYVNLAEYRKDPPKELVEGHFLNFWKKREGRDWRTVFFPLYWRSLVQGDETFFLWPFYGRREKATAVEYSTLWPFFRLETDPDEKETDVNFLWPLVRDHRIASRRHARFLPLFSSTQDPQNREEPSLLGLGLALPVPLAYRAVGKGYRYHRVFYLAWITENEDAVRHVVFNHYFFQNKKSETVHQGVFPLYHGSRWGGNALDLVLPLYGAYRRPGFSFETLLPLYWRYASSETATTAFAPFYLDYRSGPTGLSILFPFYYHTRDDERKTELNYYFPVYGTYRRGERVTRHLLFFPLYSRLRDAELGLSSLDLLWPIFHIERSSTTASTRLLPLFWRSSGPERSFALAFPFYWQFESPQSRQRYLLPLYGSYERRGELRVSVLGPFYWRVERPREAYDRTDILGSLYSRAQAGEEARSHLLPFYWRWSSPEREARYFPPLGGYEALSDGYSNRFFLGINQTLNLFEFERAPRYRERSDRALLYFSREDRTSALTTLFPFYWKWRDPEETGHVLFPFFGRHENIPDRTWSLSLLGLPEGFSLFEFGEDRKRDRRSSRILLFYRGREREGRRTVLFPFFWQSVFPESTRSQLFPFYAYRREASEGEKGFGLLGFTSRWSLYSWSDTPLEKSNRLWPLYGYGWDKREKESHFALLGFHRKASLFLKEGRGGDVRHRLFPLYGYERRGLKGSADFYREAKLLWRLYYLEEQGKDRSDLRLLYRFLRLYRAPEESGFELNPFYFSERKPTGSYWAVLGGLFGVRTRTDGSRDYTFLWVLY